MTEQERILQSLNQIKKDDKSVYTALVEINDSRDRFTIKFSEWKDERFELSDSGYCLKGASNGDYSSFYTIWQLLSQYKQSLTDKTQEK